MPDNHNKSRARSPFSDLHGASRLAVDAVAGVTDIVEDMHRNIARVAPIVGKAPKGGAGGISGFVYRSVRGVTRAVGFGLDSVLGQLIPLLQSESDASSPRREAVLAALNGVFGDYLSATNNPLAISMALRCNGEALSLEKPSLKKSFGRTSSKSAKGKLVVLVHGLCMNDLEWLREGHDHGAALRQDLGYTTLYLHYNSGRHISTNGQEFAHTLEQLIRAWPVPVKELVIIGHSMGGLVSRSACHYAERAKHKWPSHLKKLIFLGSPHHGAPLERAGHWVDILIAISPYTAPFARLAHVRSAGVKDLRNGSIRDEDWQEIGKHPRNGRSLVSLPELPRGVRTFAIAATTQEKPGGRLPGDGLVPVMSALGQHKDAKSTLAIPASHQRVFYGLDHFDLLSRRDVYDQIRDWLA